MQIRLLRLPEILAGMKAALTLLLLLCLAVRPAFAYCTDDLPCYDGGAAFVYRTPNANQTFEDLDADLTACVKKERPCLCILEFERINSSSGPFVTAGEGTESRNAFFFVDRLERGVEAKFVWIDKCSIDETMAFWESLPLRKHRPPTQPQQVFRFGKATKF